jgi:hypothetical protein
MKVDAMTFRLLMERADNALQNLGMIVPGGGAAMADWKRFSTSLGEPFFVAMNAAHVTETLINAPPRKRLNINGSAQWGDPVAPLSLSSQGVPYPQGFYQPAFCQLGPCRPEPAGRPAVHEVGRRRRRRSLKRTTHLSGPETSALQFSS